MRRSVVPMLSFAGGVLLLVVLAGLGDPHAVRAVDDPPPFVCPEGCGCVQLNPSTKFCATGTLCSVVNELEECYRLSVDDQDAIKYEITGGQIPDGCKNAEKKTSCSEENFNCYRKTWCTLNEVNQCVISTKDQGLPVQAVRKKVSDCSEPGPGPGTGT